MSIHFKASEEIPEAHRPQVEDALKYTTDELCKLLIAAGIPTHQLNDALREAKLGKKHLVRDGKAQHPIPLSVKLKIDVPRAKLPSKPDESKQPDRSGEGKSYLAIKAREKADNEEKEDNKRKANDLKALRKAANPGKWNIPPLAKTIRECAKIMGIPKNETRLLLRALCVSRSQAEAIGQLAGQQEIAEKGYKRHSKFIVRYHGPDDMTIAPLREWEFKGTNDDSLSVDKDSKGNKQCSQKKNKARAKAMLGKINKIGVRGKKRQGGPYGEGEINELWQSVEDLSGKKEHYSVHANTKTGKYRVCRRNKKGKAIDTSEFKQIKNFAAKKLIIEVLFYHG